MSVIEASPAGTAILTAHNLANASSYLGEVVWPSYNKTEIPHTTVAAAFASAGLARYTPKLSSPPDVFRRVCKDLLVATIHHDDETRSKIRNVEIGDNPQEIARRVVVEHLDSKGGRLSYEQTWDLRFNKDSGHLAMYPVTIEQDGTVRSRDRHANPMVGDEYLAEIQPAYTRALVSIDKEGLARAATKALDEAQAVPVRHGGIVYYVPYQNRDVVTGLKQVASQLDGMTMGGVSIPNTPDQVAAVTDGINDRTTAEASALIRELQAAKRGDGRPLGTRRVKTMLTEHATMKKRLVRYREVLNDELEDATTQVRVLSKLMADVLDLPALDDEAAP